MKNLKLFCTEQELYKRTYYVVTPLYHGFLLHSENELWIAMKNWCRKTLDKKNSWPDLHSPLREAWYSNQYQFWFRQFDDRELFIKHFNSL